MDNEIVTTTMQGLFKRVETNYTGLTENIKKNNYYMLGLNVLSDYSYIKISTKEDIEQKYLYILGIKVKSKSSYEKHYTKEQSIKRSWEKKHTI